MNTKNILKYKFISFFVGVFLACTYVYDIFNVLMYLMSILFCISAYDFHNKKNL